MRTLVAACTLALLFSGLASAGQPNVVLIITDDQGYGDFSIHGNPHLDTPRLDQLARESVRFERFYVNSFCAPTRAALLTGRYPLRTGCHGVTHNRESMRPSEVTLAEVLRDAGYQTACVGKWHNGEQYPMTPQGQGFNESFGFNNGHWNNYFDATLLRGSTPEKTKGYISDVLTDEAIGFIERNRNEPFFCYLSFNAPHSPYQVPDRYFEKYRDQGFDEKVAAFYGMCENIDENVGRLLDRLDEWELRDDTIVLFLTDNGGTAGVKIYNAGMRGGKTSVHEGGSRVPLFVRWPAAKWKPHVANPITSHIDILPTLLDLCDVKSPNVKIDGVSLRPLLENEEAKAWPERVLFTHNPINETNRYPGAVRTQKYRLVREIKGPAGGSKAKANDKSAKAWQLYDMIADPGQEQDIADQYPQIVTELAQQYEAWIDDVSEQGLERFPIAVGYDEHNPVELHAPQGFIVDPLTFANGPGFANDWLEGWTDPQATVRFDLDVVRPGTYDVRLGFACPEHAAGSKVRLAAGEESIEVTVPVGEAPEIPLPHRDEDGKSRYRNRQWPSLSIGSIRLPKGRTELVLQPLSMPGGQVMDFKHIQLERRP